MDSEMETEDKNKLAPEANKIRRWTFFDNYDYEYWLRKFSLLASDNGHDVGWAKEGKACDKCSKIIGHCRWRLYPDECGNFWRTSMKQDPKYPFGIFDSIDTGNEYDTPSYVKWLLSL